MPAGLLLIDSVASCQRGSVEKAAWLWTLEGGYGESRHPLGHSSGLEGRTLVGSQDAQTLSRAILGTDPGADRVSGRFASRLDDRYPERREQWLSGGYQVGESWGTRGGARDKGWSGRTDGCFPQVAVHSLCNSDS